MEAKDINVLEMINNDMLTISTNEMLNTYTNCSIKCFKDLKYEKLNYNEEKCIENCLYNHFENRNINKI